MELPTRQWPRGRRSAWRSQDIDLDIGTGPLRTCCWSRSFVASKDKVIHHVAHTRSGCLSGRLAGNRNLHWVVMGRRHDRFLDRSLWWLLGAASGALIVALALGTERREKPRGRASSRQSSQDRAVPVVRIDDAREVAAAVIAGLDRHDKKAG